MRTAYTLIAAQLIGAIGMGLLLPVLPFFLQTRGADAVAVTQFVAVYALVGALLAPGIGRLSDQVGRKPVLIAGASAAGLMYLLYPLAASLPALFALRAVSGACEARGGVTQAWLIDATQESDRARLLGLLSAMNGIGMLLGPFVASAVLALGGGYQAIFIVGAGLSIATAMAIAAVPSPPLTSMARQASNKATDDHALLAMNFLIFLLFSVIFSMSAIYMQAAFGWTAKEAGLGIGAMTGAVALARASVAHRCLARFGHVRTTGWATVLMGGFAFAAALPETPALFLVCYCLGAMAYAVAAIGVTVILAERTPEARRGHAMGRLSAAGSAAIVIGAATHGYLFENLAPAAPFLIYGAIVLALASLWLPFNLRRHVHGQT